MKVCENAKKQAITDLLVPNGSRDAVMQDNEKMKVKYLRSL